jgi:hypothetical protein
MGAAHITLDLPVPPSVNITRRIDRVGEKRRRKFYLTADLFISANGSRPAPVRVITGAYELHIQIPESASRLDLDNHRKCLIDYLVSREFVAGDSKHQLRRLVVEWIPAGHVHMPACHVTIKPWEDDA